MADKGYCCRDRHIVSIIMPPSIKAAKIKSMIGQVSFCGKRAGADGADGGFAPGEEASGVAEGGRGVETVTVLSLLVSSFSDTFSL